MPCIKHKPTTDPTCKQCVYADLKAAGKDPVECGEHSWFFDPEDMCPKCQAEMLQVVQGPKYTKPQPRRDLGNATTYKGFYDKLLARCGQKFRKKSRISKLLDILALRPTASPPKVMRELTNARQQKKALLKSVNKKYGDILDDLEAALISPMKLQKHRRQSFSHHLHIGAENELRNTTLCLLTPGDKPVNISYGNVVARTVATSDVGDIPLVELQVEGAGQGDEHSGPTAIIEHIGGPISPRDALYDVSRDALKLFHDVLETPPTKWTATKNVKDVADNLHPIKDWLKAYNAKLEPLGEDYQKFKLVELKRTGHTWYLAAGKTGANTQVNFEVPLRKVLDPKYIALYDDRGDNARILTSAAKLGQARANDYSGGDNKLLAATFALFYYWQTVQYNQEKHNAITKKNPSAHERKNKFELLPKAPYNDIVRIGLTDAEKTALLLKTKGTWDTVKTDLVADTKKCITDSNVFKTAYEDGYLPDLEDYIVAIFKPGEGSRYVGESGNAYGTDVKSRCKRLDGCFLPHLHTGACNNDFDKVPKADRPIGPRAGRPAPVQLHWVEGGDIEPCIVFECRSTDHKIAPMGKHSGLDDLEGFETLEKALTLDDMGYVN